MLNFLFLLAILFVIPILNANGGYVYFSESYVRLKAISIMVHKDAVPKKLMKS